jgi:hypothetical protein
MIFLKKFYSLTDRLWCINKLHLTKGYYVKQTLIILSVLLSITASATDDVLLKYYNGKFDAPIDCLESHIKDSCTSGETPQVYFAECNGHTRARDINGKTYEIAHTFELHSPVILAKPVMEVTVRAERANYMKEISDQYPMCDKKSLKDATKAVIESSSKIEAPKKDNDAKVSDQSRDKIKEVNNVSVDQKSDAASAVAK